VRCFHRSIETHGDLIYIHDDNSHCSFSARRLRQGQEVSRNHRKSISKSVVYVRRTLVNHDPVQAVKELSIALKPYTSVPRISQLWRRIQELQGEIRTLLEADFDT
jgi:hypothetical protein